MEQLHKSKYHATHFGVLYERQLTETYDMLNRALRQAISLLLNFPTHGVQRSPKKIGLGLLSVRDRATQMGIERLICTMNKDTDRGHLAHFHALRILTQFNHSHTEALESNPLKLPSLRILRLANTVKGLELENLPPLLY